MAYLYFIIKDHPFTDGNKRTAILVFEIFCGLNNLDPIYSDLSLDEIAVFLEKTQSSDPYSVIKDFVRVLF